jgi:hypothetical protein
MSVELLLAVLSILIPATGVMIGMLYKGLKEQIAEVREETSKSLHKIEATINEQSAHRARLLDQMNQRIEVQDSKRELATDKLGTKIEQVGVDLSKVSLKLERVSTQVNVRLSNIEERSNQRRRTDPKEQNDNDV